MHTLLPLLPELSNFFFDVPKGIQFKVLKHLCILCTMGSNSLKTGHCLDFLPKESSFGGKKIDDCVDACLNFKTKVLDIATGTKLKSCDICVRFM